MESNTNVADAIAARTVVLVISGAEYKIEFPKVAVIIDAESLKVSLASAQYGRMQMAMQGNVNVALDLIDMVAYFTTFIPSLKERLRLDTILDMNVDEVKPLLNEYRTKFKPWYEKCLDILRSNA